MYTNNNLRPVDSIRNHALTAIIVLSLLASSLLGIQAVRAQNQPEQLTVAISPSGKIEASAVYFAATVDGGTLPYSFQWYVNNTMVEGAVALHYTFDPASTGAYLIYATVTDSLNSSATSNVTTVTVKLYLQIDLASHNYMNNVSVGQPVYFSAVVSNGVAPYKYQWYYQPYYVGTAIGDLYPTGNKTEGAASQNFTFTPNSTGYYLIEVRVWDSAGAEGYFMSLPPGIWVNAKDSVSTLSPSISPTPDSSQSPIPSPSIPEFPFWVLLPLVLLASVLVIQLSKKKPRARLLIKFDASFFSCK
jgi:hypothetical protein